MFFMYLGHLVPVYSFVQDGLASGVGGRRVCVWLMGADGYGVWVVVESVWLEGYGWSQGCN